MKLLHAILLASLLACAARGQDFSALWSFGSTNAGGVPQLPLIPGPGGKLYGTTTDGSTNFNGTIFSVNLDGSGFTNIYAFSEGGLTADFEYTNSDGMNPYALILSGNSLYGTCQNGGTNGNGTIFRVQTDGSDFTTLYTFSALGNNQFFASTNGDGVFPTGLVLSGDTLYGSAFNGGTNGNGTVYSLETNGDNFIVLHTFTGSDGWGPNAGLLLFGSILYGTAQNGGANGNGAIFSFDTIANSFSNLYSFSASATNLNSQFTNDDGASPIAGLVLGGQYLYGTAEGGGTNGNGTVYALNTKGNVLTTLYNFTNGTDGAYPQASLLLSGRDLFGTASGGGANSNGTVFVVHIDGTGFSNLYTFSPKFSDAADDFNSTNSDGSSPEGGLILSGDTIYGTAANGGSFGYGTIFSLTVPPAYLTPAISIHISSGSLVISWPFGSGGTTLMSADSLSASAVWSPVTILPVLANGSYSITIPLTGKQAFFYLSP
ncbi:MAG: choice-of-anchor tandem repeat GloVer-containing protein [Verrucomicrobiota bacterium]|jgi:uncharacterized repeat protein (TIGR03803 family)